DGKALVVTHAKNNSMSIHELPSGKLLRQFKGELIQFSSPVYSPDGQSLVVNHGKRGVAIRIWDPDTGKERVRLEKSRFDETEMSLSNDGKLVAAAGPESSDFAVWESATGKQIRVVTPVTKARRVQIAPDNKTVFTESSDGAIQAWDLETGKSLPLSANPVTAVCDLRFDRAGKLLIGSTDIFRAWDPATGLEVKQFPAGSGLSALSPDATILATSKDDGTIRLLDATTGNEIRAWKGHDRTLWVLMFSADGKRLYSTCGWDPRIRVWETATGR